MVFRSNETARVAQLEIDRQFVWNLREAAERRYNKWKSKENYKEASRLDMEYNSLKNKIKREANKIKRNQC